MFTIKETLSREFKPVICWKSNQVIYLSAEEHLAEILTQCLLEAIQLSKVEHVKAIISKRPVNINRPPVTQSNTPLHLACSIGNASIVSLLIEAGADIYLANECGQSTLAIAMANGHADIVALILAADRKQQKGLVKYYFGQEGKTPWHDAVGTGNSNILTALLENEPYIPGQVDFYGSTPLHTVISMIHPMKQNLSEILKIIQILVAHGENVHHANPAGQTSLDLAAKQGHSEIMALLLQLAGYHFHQHPLKAEAAARPTIVIPASLFGQSALPGQSTALAPSDTKAVNLSPPGH